MGVSGFFRKLFGLKGAVEERDDDPARGRDVFELAQRLGIGVDQLRAARAEYREFEIPKRSGGKRRIAAPAPELKALQRRILRRLLGKLASHPSATGFEKRHSIVTNAKPHAGAAVVVRMDLRDFFTSTGSKRVRAYFRKIGWNGEASDLLTNLCTFNGGLPQGAPTSPRLSNLVNYRLDTRLLKLGDRFGAAYSRYADDITFSFRKDDRVVVHAVIHATKEIVGDEGYKLHQRRKLQIRRRSDRQVVTGLVVNVRPNLPRQVRRRLRAVEHHAKAGKPATLSAQQLEGWRSLRSMIARQNGAAPG